MFEQRNRIASLRHRAATARGAAAHLSIRAERQELERYAADLEAQVNGLESGELLQGKQDNDKAN
jgi:hypothetical protein